MGAVLCPQVLDGLAAQRGIWLGPQGDVAAG
jgi:hypothetical protein